MKFNQVLQTQPSAQQAVTQPNVVESAAGVLGGVVDTVSNFMEKNRNTRLAEETQRILNLEDDLVNQGVGANRRREILRQELRTTLNDDPEMNLALRKALGGFGSAALASGENETDRRNADIQAMYNSLDPAVIRQFKEGDPTDTDGITVADMEVIIQKATAQEEELRKSVAKKKEALAEAEKNQTAAVKSFGEGMNSQFEANVNPSLQGYITQLESLDLNDPQAVEKFEQLRTGALQSTASYRQLINAEYAALLPKLTDSSMRQAAEEQRDALLKVVSDFETTFLSPTAELDVKKQQTRALDIATNNFKMTNKDAIATITGFQDALGSQAMGVVFSKAFVDNPNLFSGFQGDVSKALESLISFQNTADDDTKFPTPQDFKNTWGTLRATANGIRGVPTLETSEALYKGFVAAANTAADGGLGVDDMNQLLSDYTRFEEFWKNLPEPQQQFIKTQKNKIELQTLIDPVEGRIAQALRNDVFEYNAEEGVFVLDTQGIEGVGASEMMRGGMAPAGTGRGRQTGRQAGWTQSVIRQRQKEVSSLNESINSMVEFTIEEFKKDGRNITERQARGFLGLPLPQ